MRLLLDTGVLGMVCHPKKHRPLALWLRGVLEDPDKRISVFLPCSDYELRRKLIHLARYKKTPEARKSLQRLDELVGVLEYLPLDVEAMWRAADLWADARGLGQSTAASEALDGDVILAAQAQLIDGAVVTTNVKHLSRFVTVYPWEYFVEESENEERTPDGN